MSSKETIDRRSFRPALAARFDALVEKYPVKRSALVPMLLYAQDEIGYLSDAVIAEVARRIGITELDVRNVATLLLHAALQAGRQIQHPGLHQHLLHVARRLRHATIASRRSCGIGPKGVTADGLFSLEEVECIGACSWAPAIQVNYDFHDELKPDHVPGILDGYRGKAQAEGKN